jgi:hypothetical protein
MKVTSKDCKEFLVQWVQKNQPIVAAQFIPSLDANQFKLACNPNNWKRIEKYKSGDVVVRIFDCKPFDDQLRGTVIEKNGLLIDAEAHGE